MEKITDQSATPTETDASIKRRNTAKKQIDALTNKVAILENQLTTKQTELQQAVNRVAEVEHYLRKLTGIK